MKIQSINPYTEEVIREFDLMPPKQIEGEIDHARLTFDAWSCMPLSRRTEYVKKLGEHLRKDKRRYGAIMTSEMGKPIREAVSEVEKCAWLCDFSAENAEKMLRPETVRTEAKKSYVLFQPLGIVLGIMPWTFPFWQVFRFGIPALIAGNVILLKHASNVPLSALAIEEAFLKAGFPKGVFTTLLIGAKDAMGLIEEEKVDAVSLTGSHVAGSQVGAIACRRIKKVVLELGGSDPFIVLKDANLERAAKMAASARMINTGQSCIAAKRFIVDRKIEEEFSARFLAHLKELRIGDPMDESTDIGPVAKRDILDSLNVQLDDAREKGAEILGTGRTFEKGFFFPPCAIRRLTQDMKVLTEEVFGPIAPIIPVNDEEEAILVANATEFGLGASLWTGNLEKGERLAARLEAGMIAVNDMVKSDPRMPFGGIKKSGFGRELSYYGMREFVNIKTVVVRE